MRYRPEIDGLRALAILPVLFFHAGFSAFSGGFIGVDVFFVISGFLITRIICDELDKGTFSLLHFYERRARRILPALFLVVACCIPVAWLLMRPDQYQSFARSVIALSLFASNFLFWSEAGYFDLASEEKPLLHSWSLSVEEQFYIVFPLLLLLLSRRCSTYRPVILAVLAVVSFSLCEWASRTYPVANFYLAPTRMWELMSGALCSILARSSLFLRGMPQPIGRKGAAFLAAAGLGMVVLPVFFFDGATTAFPSRYTLLPVGGAALVLLFATKDNLSGRLLALPPLVGIGLMSYSAYLWHQPLFVFLRFLVFQPGPLLLCLTSLLSLVLAYVSWRFVESPFRRRSAPYRVRTPVIWTGAFSGSFLLAMAGLWGIMSPPVLSAPRAARLANIEMLAAQRQRAIKAGDCHFNHGGTHPDINSFLKNWSCVHDDEEGLISLHAAVYGDSHSADKAWALRRAGYDVAQLGGADCALAPTIAAPNVHCDRLLNFFHAMTAKEGIDTVFLAERLQPHERTFDNIQRILAYWSARYARVFLFVPMVEYTGLKDLYIDYGAEALLRMPVDDAARRDFLRYTELNVSPEPHEQPVTRAYSTSGAVPTRNKNIILLDTAYYFCARRQACAPIEGKDLLLIDYGHLTSRGAAIFATGLCAPISVFFPDTEVSSVCVSQARQR